MTVEILTPGARRSKEIGRLTGLLLASHRRRFNNPHVSHTSEIIAQLYSLRMISDGPGAQVNNRFPIDSLETFTARVSTFAKSARTWQLGTFHTNTRRFLLENSLLR